MDTSTLVTWHGVGGALLFSGIGLAIYVIGFVLLDLLTPKVQVWHQICEEKNVALAIFLGSIVLGIAIIISSAVRG